MRRRKTGKEKKFGFHTNSARNAAQPTYSGRKDFPNFGHFGSAKTAVTTERSFLEDGNLAVKLRRVEKENGLWFKIVIPHP